MRVGSCLKNFISGLLAWGLGAASCTPLAEVAGVDYPVAVGHLRFLGSYTLPDSTFFRGTLVGGLSGIDYDAKRDLYYLICDDRSDRHPARFYTARIQTSLQGIGGVQWVNHTPLRQPDGRVYPSTRQDPSRSPDPEALRYDPLRRQFVWSSEGERLTGRTPPVLQHPALLSLSRRGAFADSFPLPPQLRMQAVEKGARRNGAFEGLAFADGYRTLYACMEEPLYEDGPRAGGGDTAAWVRLVRYDAATHVPLAQYAYRVAPVAHEAVPGGAFRINGVSDILGVGNYQLLVTERSFSTGVKNCTIRLFLASLDGAEDVSATPSLQEVPPRHPLTKKLLLDTDSLGIAIDNIEGATFGPQLPSGYPSLLLVADDNFSPQQQTQFLLFEVRP
ncbi:esterase-like activity of phytase family protein [Paraflavisolibacter sp. H34]|uniref:esterase-like activity of phytase family protein n=1 Tax=Huijunlia imazamoxiresistens TaxID=3127457 RepID=UPI00301B13B7